MAFINKNEVKSKAKGRWMQIFEKIAPWLTDTNANLNVGHTCPIHGGLDGFRFYKDAEDTGGAVCNTCGNFPDGFSLLTAATGKSFFDVLKDVSEILGHGEFKAPLPQRKISASQEKKRTQAQDRVIYMRLRSAWSGSIPIAAPASSLAKLYMSSRGLSEIPSMLRFHPEMAYLHEDKTTEIFPALLAKVTAPDGTSVTIHRTYLDPVTGSKAKVSSPKKLMSHTSDTSLKGAAIRLYPCEGDTLCIAEGIETSIAVHQATGLPVWATISAVFMESFIPPENVKRVIVFADKDRSDTGIKSAKVLVQNLWTKGIQASIQLPDSPIPEDSKGVDWLDEFVARGKSAFSKVA